MKREFLITEWDHTISSPVESGSLWKEQRMFTLNEGDMWAWVLNALAGVSQGMPRQHFSIKEVLPKISTRSIKGTTND